LHLITTALQQATAIQDRLAIIARGVRSVGWGKVAVTLLDDNLDVTELVTAGYEENEEKLLKKRLLPGQVWKRRLDDPQFISLRIGSSYFLPHDNPWVQMNTEGGGKRKSNPGSPLPPKREDWHPKDQLYIPMFAGSAIIGMINLRDPAIARRPDEAGLRPLELFVQQAASALENARLYQSTPQLQSYNEAVVQSIQQGIIVAGRDGKIETFNAFLRDQYGWTEDMYGQPLIDAHPSFREVGLEADMVRVIKSGEQTEHLGVSFPGRGESHTVNIYAYPRRDEAEAVTGVVVLIEDITARARLEADIALRGEQLAALSEVSRRITAALSVGDVVASALREVSAVLTHDRVALWLASQDGKTLHMAAGQGYTAKDAGDPEADIAAHPLFSAIYKNPQPLVIADTHEDGRFAGQKRSARSWLGAPLVSGGSIIGVLVVEKNEAHAYAPADGQVASAYANQVAVALENARLFEQSTERAAELDSRNQRLALLNRISATIGRSLDQNGILQTTANELAQALGVPQASIFIYDQDNRFARLTIQSPSNPDGGVPDVSFSLDGNPLIDRLRDERTPLAIDDAENDPLLVAMRDVIAVRMIQSILVIPLIIGNSTVGLITVDSTENKVHFAAEQIELAQTIINQAAVSVQNARLYEQTAARQTELTILFEAGRITSSSLDLDTIASSAAGYFIRALSVDGCGVSLYNKTDDALTTLILFENSAHDGQPEGARP
ncbi:MAG TPA: GAF domain-containing protein, partial [Candidatus Edwardsbacteria bacterium]|nr:GAF domain-containing protein [Candidatus Edwardsbacteria bacterium]